MGALVGAFVGATVGACVGASVGDGVGGVGAGVVYCGSPPHVIAKHLLQVACVCPASQQASHTLQSDMIDPHCTVSSSCPQLGGIVHPGVGATVGATVGVLVGAGVGARVSGGVSAGVGAGVPLLSDPCSTHA